MNALTSFMPLLLCSARDTELDGSLSYSGCRNKGHDIWPSPADGTVAIAAAQLAYMLDGIDWRNPVLTWRPQAAG